MTYALTCPWCKWLGMTSGVGDDSPADFLREDFLRHVRKEHPSNTQLAEFIDPERVERTD
ncbi:MAG: hypothetical protein JRG93_11155 [Deltaproteobacteria bacterium]|nr:hypothetical protein [Deltaproteobacteria bacterium]